MRRIGVLTFLAADDPESKIYIAAFRQQLRESGWIVGHNVQIDYRSTAGQADLIRKYAAELIGLAPDVILTAGGSHVGPLQQATRTVPIGLISYGPDLVDQYRRAAGYVGRIES